MNLGVSQCSCQQHVKCAGARSGSLARSSEGAESEAGKVEAPCFPQSKVCGIACHSQIESIRTVNVCAGGSSGSLARSSEGAESEARESGSAEGQGKAATSVNWMHVSQLHHSPTCTCPFHQHPP